MSESGGERDEEVLIARARRGDEEAFGELVRRHQDRLYAVVYGFVRNAEDAKELAQQTWIKAWQKLDTFAGRSRFYTWLYRIAVFQCMDFVRRKARDRETGLLEEVEPRREAGAEAPPSVESRPDRQVERTEIQAHFRRALDELAPDHRMALVLREVEGMSYKEIAGAMKCRLGTVMSRIFYARQALREKMKDLR